MLVSVGRLGAVSVSNVSDDHKQLDVLHEVQLYVDKFILTKKSLKTPAYIKYMIDYSLVEIEQSVSENTLNDYIETLEELVIRLLSAEYPLWLVSDIDLADLFKKLDDCQREMEGQNPALGLNNSREQICSLKESVLFFKDTEKFVAPKIEDHREIWMNPVNWGRQIFETPKLRPVPADLSLQMPELEQYRIAPINNDGACWARALWHTTLSQIRSEEELRGFSQKIEDTVQTFAKEPRFFINNDLSDVIAIVHALSKMDAQERLNAFCYEHIDRKLQVFARKIISAILRRENIEQSTESQEYIDRIEMLNTFGGAHEINCFVKYFNVQIQEIVALWKESAFVPQFHNYGKQNDLASLSLHDAVMFGTSPIHYELLVRSK